MNAIQTKYKGKLFTLIILQEIAKAVSEMGEVTSNAKKHGRTTKWSQNIEMYIPVRVGVSEANPDKGQEGDYYAYVSWHEDATGMPVWVPKSQQDGYVQAQFKVRYRPGQKNPAFVFGTNTRDVEKNVVARVRRICDGLADDNPAKEAIRQAFKEERCFLGVRKAPTKL
jgi:hypothetical protein